jgi:hypothetical protein
MHRRILLLFFLISGSLIAMDDGVWDERGNYLGPRMPTSPIFVPVPVQMVQFVPVFVHMHMLGDSMGFPMGYMPPIQPPLFPIVLDTAAVLENNSQKIGQWRVVGEAPVHAHDDADEIVDQCDNEVAAITSNMESVGLHQETQVSSDSATAAASTHVSQSWSDDADDDAPIDLPPGWKRHAVPTDHSPLSESDQALLPLPDSAEKHEEAPHVFIRRAVQEKRKRNKQSSNAHQQLNAQGDDLLDQRLNEAMRTPKNMHIILRLLKTKIHWLTRECSSRECSRECILLTKKMQTNLGKIRPVSQHAITFLGYADTCIHKMQKEKAYKNKRGFACLAREFITIAQKSTLAPDEKLRIQNQLSSIPEDATVADLDTDSDVYK